MDGWATFSDATAQLVTYDSYTGDYSLEVTVGSNGAGDTGESHGIFRMYPVGSQLASARVKVFSGQVRIYVVAGSGHAGSWYGDYIGPGDEWQLTTANGDSTGDEICVYAGADGAFFLVDHIRVDPLPCPGDPDFANWNIVSDPLELDEFENEYFNNCYNYAIKLKT